MHAKLWYSVLRRLEPLVYRIYQRRSAIVCPVIDFISDRTIEYRGAAEVKVGGFSWWLLFKWAEFHPDDRKFRKSELQPLMYLLIVLLAELATRCLTFV